MALTYGETKKLVAAQKQGEKIIKLYYETSADQVKFGDGAKTVEEVLSSLNTTVSNFLTGEPDDNGVIDRLSELVKSIEANKTGIDALVADHVKKTEIVDDLTTGGTDKVLSAEQGKALKALIDAINTTVEGSSHTHANQTDLDKLSVVDGMVAVDGKVKKWVMNVAALPETMPEDLADGGILLVG